MYLESNSIVKFVLPDLLYQPVLDASSFDNASHFGYDFDFDFDLQSNGGDSKVSSHAKEPDRDPKGEAVNQNFDASLADPSDESEWAIFAATRQGKGGQISAGAASNKRETCEVDGYVN